MEVDSDGGDRHGNLGFRTRTCRVRIIHDGSRGFLKGAMPIIRIEALAEPSLDIPGLLDRVSEAAAGSFGLPKKHCWVIFTRIPGGCYLEGGRIRFDEDAQSVSPVVTVVAAEGPSREKKAAVLGAVARAAGTGLGVDPDGVLVQYVEIPPGHAFSGGQVR